MRFRWFPFTLVLIFGGCKEPPPPTELSSDPPIGQMRYAIGSEVREIPYGEVRCNPDGDAIMVELVSNRVVRGPQGVGQRPRVLIARIRGEEVLEAHAFAYDVTHAEISYTMLQFVAKVPGTRPAECRLERDGEKTEVACNQTTVVGWRGSGEPPRPSFTAEWDAQSCQDG